MPLDISGILSTVKANIGDGSRFLNGDAIAAQAQQDLVNCMNAAISGSLMGNEMSAVGSAVAGGISKLSNTEYQIGVSIPAQFRPSLMPEIYGGVDDMAALFNNGYSAHQLTVYYPNTGEVKKSRPFRSPAQFVQTGLNMFAGSGGGNYTVVSTQVSGRFGG